VGEDAPPDGEYPANETTNPIRVAGTYVAAASTSGQGEAAACSKYTGMVTSCPSVPSWIQALDARTHRRIRLPTASGVTALAASSAGAVAWVEYPSPTTSVLHAIVLGRGGPNQLAGSVQTLETDTGPAANSLHFTGLTLRWTLAGQPKSFTLQ
jgi:hypothetical protein